ncbi:hypothetical protein [Mesorhizobium sp. B2-4-9]|uniref:hypothetical protein n=1 Tax=Mesorhizobium sp. B2-4-9 TaxID=2589940 RepID=UPI001FEDA69A|nr:hypothetical protein [Mesorhizobium sp. B2-4-9]
MLLPPSRNVGSIARVGSRRGGFFAFIAEQTGCLPDWSPEASRRLKKEKAEWLKPGLVGRVKFLKGEEKLRHAKLKDFRVV